MLHKFCLIGVLFVVLSTSLRGEWVSLKNGASQPVAPRVTVLQNDPGSTVVRIEISGFETTDLQVGGKRYQVIDLLTETATARPGSPEVPYLATMLAIPDRGGVSVEIEEMGEMKTFGGLVLPPARPSWQEGSPEPEYVENEAAYHSHAGYPESRVSVDDPVVFRDFRVARVAMYPVRYVSETKELQVASTMTVRVRYGTGSEVNPRTAMKRPIPRSFGSLYRTSLINYQSVLNRDYSGMEVGREVLLCIVPDTFATTFRTYADWKHKTGTFVKVVTFSEIGATSSNPDIIRDYVGQCYHNWQYPPTYVLLVGDYQQFPIRAADGETFANDDYFVEIDGNDVFPEMYVGRFTQNVNSIPGLQTIINRLIKYERYPYRVNQDWFKHAVLCSNTVDPTQQETKRWVSSVMTGSGGFVVDTLLPIGTNCTYSLAQVINAINSGRGYLNYRGEGSSSGWWASCYYFQTSDVASVNNGDMTTFVTSIGCGVANFTASDCFGEAWMELGTPTATRGSCAFVGPTWWNTHAIYNNEIDKGLYVALLQEGMNTPGQTLLRGKIRMYNRYGGGDPQVLWHFRTYTVLGDPSTRIWKEVPTKVDITYTSQISIGYNQVQVTVVDSATHAPVGGAEVCIAGDSVYVTGTTDASGLAIIPVTPPTVDTLTLLVHGISVVPAEGTILVVPQQEHVAPLGDPVVTDLDGNHDGKVNPNEHIQISYVLKNWGTQTSSNVQATLSVPDTSYATIVNAGPVAYGNLLPNGSGSATGTPLQFFVKPTTAVGSRISLRLDVASSSRSWNYTTYQDVVGCNLEYVSTAVDDQGSPRNNGRLDPGETAVLYLTVTNTGQDVAPNVAGVLRTADPYITILDSTGSFGTVSIGANGTSTTNFFIVSVSSSCPLESLHDFALTLTTQGGNYAYSVARTFRLSVGLPSFTDPTGPDAYGYYAYSSDDSLYDQAPTYDWVEIRSVGTRVTYVSPGDFTVARTLPFTFKYYGRNYTSVRLSSDGWIAFGTGTQTSWENYTLPHSDNVTNMLALFWDDLFESSNNPTSKLLYYSDAANHRFIIEWDSVGHYSGTTLRESFQAILFDPAFYPTPTGDGEVIFQYRIVGSEGSCTVGIEDSTQTIGLQYLYNSIYATSAADIRASVAIRWTTIPPSLSPTHITVAVPIGVGWNLVSNPVLRPDSINGVRRLYQHSVSDYAFRFEPGSGYVQSYVMPNGPGFWVKFPGDELNLITGSRILADSIPVSSGWNLIGSISSIVDTSAIKTIPLGLRASNYFGYSGGYATVVRLDPGKGYWVKANGPGQFVLEPSLPANSARPILTGGPGFEQLSSITISDSKGASQTLYFGQDPKNKFAASEYLLPPPPPSGAFDARFENVDGGTMVETHAEIGKEAIELPIRLQSSCYPLTVTWNIVGASTYELKDALGGQCVPTRSMSGTGSLKITSSEVERLVLRVVGSGELPTEYSLSQNYPNPFNPVTVVKYALPVESRVSLKVYNTLGQQVRTLLNEVERAGYKSVNWNSQTERGTQAASGVYFIRLDAKGVNGSTFSQVRKMVLVK